MAAQEGARLEFQAEMEEKRRQSQGNARQLSKETDAGDLSGMPQPCGNTQNNRNGFL